MAHRKHGSHLLSSEDLDALLDTTNYDAPPNASPANATRRTEEEHELHATHQPFASLKDLINHPPH